MKKFSWTAALLVAMHCFGQSQMPEAEKKELGQALAEAGNSPLEYARAIERHLEKYPDSADRDELERALVKAAMDVNDKPRVLKWGQKSLAKNLNQPQVLERVARLLLESDDKESSEQALKYASKYEEIVRELWKQSPSKASQKAKFVDQMDRATGRALSLQARAPGNLGDIEKAAALAIKSFDAYPSHEAAREAGKWLARQGKAVEAARWYADAFVAPDSPAELRAKDRALLAEQYRKGKGTETGMGDLVLEAHDRAVESGAKRLARMREFDPNTGVSDPIDYTLSALKGDPLPLASLKGKVIVMDFWATWCGPCRVQQPLYEQVKEKFAGDDKVVFLAINTDEDSSLVQPFLESNDWNKTVYFEDGLSELLRVSSIPTTVVFDTQGRVSSRMNGFVPEKFVDQLTARIKEALAE